MKPALVTTDLDGTLLRSDGTLSARNRSTLEGLRRAGVVCVIATGRSLFSARKVLPLATPIDYLVFSTGAGIYDWQAQRLLCSHHLEVAKAQALCQVLREQRVDFMLHHEIPDNHRFSFEQVSQRNADFSRRIERYRSYCTPLAACAQVGRLTQAVVVIPPGPAPIEEMRRALPGMQVIRTTSPLDGESTWIEIFAATVSKSAAVAWLCEQGLASAVGSVAVGNDYNDRDLLEWSERAFVVANAPPSLRDRFTVVGSNDDDGFSAAVARGREAGPAA